MIKNIIFDLGAVILNIDTALTINAFKNLGIAEFEKIYLQDDKKQLFDRFETGKISPNDFRIALRNFLPENTTNEHIDVAWNAMLLDLPMERLNLLSSLKEKYRLFLLSNTNEIHINFYSAYLKKSFGFNNLGHLFEKEYYSYKINMQKPDPKIFEFVLNENRIKAKETLFIDDSFQHIESAKALGISTHHLIKPQTILDIDFQIDFVS